MSMLMKACPNPACEGLEQGGAVQLERLPVWEGDSHGYQARYFVTCGWCEMKGPWGDEEEDAIDAWNGLPRRDDAAGAEKDAE